MIKTEYCLITLTEKAYTLRRTLFIVAWDTIKTLLFSTLESGQTIKFNHHNSVRHCSGIPEKSPTQEACNSAWLLWCLLTQEAYPEASSTPRPPSCKCPNLLQKYTMLSSCSGSVSVQQRPVSIEFCLGTADQKVQRWQVICQVQPVRESFI